MSMAMNIGTTGIKAANTDLNTISHNVANISTTGFKNSRAEFADLVDSNAAKGGGLGVMTQDVNQLFQQGSITTTGNALDLAITGNGFFTVQNTTKDDTGKITLIGDPIYTRAGSFHVDAYGNVVNNLGQSLIDTKNKEVKLPGTGPWSNIIIDKTGAITATDSTGKTVPEKIADAQKIGLVDFNNPQGLKKISETQWVASADSGPRTDPAKPPTNIGQIMSGALENSNVDLTDQLVNMILAQRNYQANSKTITTGQAITETAINMVR